jgi:hypothetical protein
MALVVAGALVLAVARLASDPDSGVDIRLGVDQINVGSALRWSEEIAESGPLILPDASPNRDRDVVVSHVGTDPNAGWQVFAARRPGTDRGCTFEVDRDRGVLIDPCADGAVVPADGGDLPRYAWQISPSGDLVIDLNTPAAAS